MIRWLRRDLFFGAPAGAPRGAHGGAVDAPQLVVDLTRVDPRGPQAGEDRVQRPVTVPRVEEVPDGAPGTELLGEVAPGRAGPEDPEDAVDDLATIARWASGAGWGWEEVTNQFPFAVRQSMPSQDTEPPWMCISVHIIMIGHSLLAKTSFLTEPGAVRRSDRDA